MTRLTLPAVALDIHQEEAVTESLQVLLQELEQFGHDNDAEIADRPRRILNISRDTGEFLSVLVRATNGPLRRTGCRRSGIYNVHGTRGKWGVSRDKGFAVNRSQSS
ncbi:MAG TPA: hypothetical protein VJ673_03000 [Aromatoleum sp.]|uniref:hypothetical protein n=1 Tax=Aromatoleum sp. TaxID=2307007 RepID=UPI002B48661D|nr:hypothetical protein [Aromatoleum sp.]HJV24622.1 hypothetical protein [Aromatoleum sp.]